MANRAAVVTQADVRRIVRAIKRETAARVRVTIDGSRVIIEEAPGEEPEKARDERKIVPL